jgi:hypothetical protein
MGSTNRKWHSDMGSDTITYLWSPKIEEYYVSYSPHGLEYGSIWMWAQVVDTDGSRYYICRELNKDSTNFVLYFKGTPGLNTEDEPVFQDRIFKGYILHHFDKDEATVTIRPQYEQGNWFKLTIKLGQFDFVDADGAVDLKYKLLATPQTWYCPGKYGILDDYMYRSQHCIISGTINGKEVSGWGGMDSEWSPPGVPARQTKRFEVLEKFWICWYTEYEDGTIEDGIYVRGYENHAAPYYVKNGKAYIPKKHHVVVKPRPDGVLESAEIYFDDMEFEYTTVALVANDVCAKADGQNTDEGGGDMAWTTGLVVNRAIKSKVKRGWASPEYKAKDCLEDPIKDMR